VRLFVVFFGFLCRLEERGYRAVLFDGLPAEGLSSSRCGCSGASFAGGSLMGASRLCRWCSAVLPPTSRADAAFCHVRCRQAHFRLTRGESVVRDARVPLRVCYADPPYPGKAKLYRGSEGFAGEVDFLSLVDRLRLDFPDGWALSTSARSLTRVLRVCPIGVEVAAWFRGVRPAKSGRVLNAWEPVIFWGGRRVRPMGDGFREDALVYTLRSRRADPKGVLGAKPGRFAFWLFDLLGLRPGDDLVDLFPGSGRVGDAWKHFCRRRPAGATGALTVVG
jgi:hypothetical protein